MKSVNPQLEKSLFWLKSGAEGFASCFILKLIGLKKKKKRPSVVRGEVWISLCYLCRGMSVMHLPTSREKAVTGRFSVKESERRR